MKSKKLYGNIVLLITALFWGSSFIAQEVAMLHIGAFTFQTARNIVGCAVLLPIILILDKRKKRELDYIPPTRTDKKLFIRAALVCGLLLCAAANLQQIGIANGTSGGKAGFITAFYMLLVPIFSLMSGKKVSPMVFPCVLLALGGLYMLCMKGESGVALCDLLVLACSFFFAVRIMATAKYAQKVDNIKLACAQFMICGAVSAVPAVIFESLSLKSLAAAMPSILYAGVFSSGIAYTFEIVGQKYTDPTVASMLMSLESVFAVITGMALLHDMPTPDEWIGSAMMFAAVIIVQLPLHKIFKKKEKRT